MLRKFDVAARDVEEVDVCARDVEGHHTNTSPPPSLRASPLAPPTNTTKTPQSGGRDVDVDARDVEEVDVAARDVDGHHPTGTTPPPPSTGTQPRTSSPPPPSPSSLAPSLVDLTFIHQCTWVKCCLK
ncbi:hypothetical protein APHAL10511_000644 [Amanita phalloides]|nr:hypothetical protein APHAL10511_000644 [Amanita phalloides]